MIGRNRGGEACLRVALGGSPVEAAGLVQFSLQFSSLADFEVLWVLGGPIPHELGWLLESTRSVGIWLMGLPFGKSSWAAGKVTWEATPWLSILQHFPEPLTSRSGAPPAPP